MEYPVGAGDNQRLPVKLQKNEKINCLPDSGVCGDDFILQHVYLPDLFQSFPE
jgi:hypothetical protein